MQNTIKQRFDLQYMAHNISTTYRSKKQVTRMMARCTQGVAKVYPRCSQALGRLMSMLRVWLEYANSMLRVCLEYAYSMPRVCLAYAYTHLIRNPYAISVRARRTGSPLLTDQESAPYGLFRTLLLLLMMMTVGIGNVLGQVDNGLYYVKILDYNGTTFNATYMLVHQLRLKQRDSLMYQDGMTQL